jgi:POT family proton-dependent oligopeptide transporter
MASSVSRENERKDFFSSKVLGHPSGLFVLFFTEMWERFSFYGMRVLLINFLTMSVIGVNPGWEWTTENAGTLFATYAGLLYITPILGGVIADKFLGYRNAVAIGALVMTLGHALMAIETELSLYGGLALLVIGTGFFKPTMTSIISEMYKDLPEKKDGAYTIFYMGVNAGAFFGMMLCGYLAEKVGWSWGFGLAGIFMMLGLLQFWFAKPLFGTIGAKPDRTTKEVIAATSKVQPADQEVDNEVAENPATSDGDSKLDEAESKLNPFTFFDKIFTVVSSFFGLVFLLDGPFNINGVKLIPDFLAITNGQGEVALPSRITFILIGLVIFFLPLVISRISRYDRIVRHRMIAVVIFAFFTVFFWMSFEQGASSLIIFARDYTIRVLSGGAATTFLVVDLLLTFVPLIIITGVLVKLWQASSSVIKTSNIILAFCFLGVWGLAVWKTNRDLNTKSYEIEVAAKVDPVTDENGEFVYNKDSGKQEFTQTFVTQGMKDELTSSDKIVTVKKKIGEYKKLEKGSQILTTFELGAFRHVDDKKLAKINTQLEDYPDKDTPIIEARVGEVKGNEVEITTSWFSILNSFFIIAFASFFSKWFDSKYNPSAAWKYGLGLIIMAIGFGVLAYGSSGLEEGTRVSLIWLVFAYLFHTLGELCSSPVGLSYVSKLVPGRMIGFMFGMWYLAIAIGNYAAGALGGLIEPIKEEYSMSTFFLIFTIVPAAAGLLIISLNPLIKKLMHGVR